MITFLTTLFASKLARKIGMYIAIGLVLGWALKIHDNSIYNKGRQEGVTVGVKEALAAAEVNWKGQIDALQKQIDASHATQTLASQARVRASDRISDTVTNTTEAQAAIPQKVALLSASDVATAIVANDATVVPDNSVNLNSHLLEAQLNVQQLDDEVKEILKDHKVYVEQTDIQIGALKEEIQATRGELSVMTAERDQYKAALATATKKRGCGLFKKIITVGLCR